MIQTWNNDCDFDDHGVRLLSSGAQILNHLTNPQGPLAKEQVMDISAAAKLKHGSPVWVWHTDLGPDLEGQWQPGTVLKVLTSGGSTSLWVFLESMESIAALNSRVW